MRRLSDRVVPLRKETLQDGVYQKLCELILEGGVAPGESVTVASLSEAFGVSPMPVREALTRLQAAGALTVVSGRTVGVPKLTRERLDDLKAVRLEVEALALAWATERRTPAFVADLRAVLQRLHEAERLRDARVYIAANHDLHFALYRHSGSPVLIGIIRNLWLQISPFFHLLRETGNFRISNRHHDEIVAAVEAGDGARAVAALRADIRDAYEVLSAVI